MLLNPTSIKKLLPSNFKVPENLEKYNPTVFPHWHLFWCLHVGACNLSDKMIRENAIIIAALDPQRLIEYNLNDYANLGIEIEFFKNVELETEEVSSESVQFLEE